MVAENDWKSRIRGRRTRRPRLIYWHARRIESYMLPC